jgi:predicted NAD-dependent protein-ADP-ribosyltransferase YbiA (DUF1768 family)
MKLLFINFFLVLFSFQIAAQSNSKYPASWWAPVPRDQAPDWEILPQDAKEGEVILSKRNELGIFSNLGHSPFKYEEVSYASVEAFWQMMKFPDKADASDERLKYSAEYPFTREQVFTLYDFESKKAGDAANLIMKKYNINWISYKGKKFNYKDMADGSAYHYKLIYSVIKAKVEQNPKIKALLLKTGNLILKPDHKQSETSPKAYFYHEILMEIRTKLQKTTK